MTTDLAIRDEQHYLATVSEVRALTERIESVGDAKSLADKARAAQVWAQRARLGADQVNLAAVAKLWAERRAGELLIDTRENGQRDLGYGDRKSESQNATPKLADLGVTKYESSRFQRLASIPLDRFEEAVEKAQAEGAISTARVTKLADRKSTAEKRAQATERIEKLREESPDFARADQQARDAGLRKLLSSALAACAPVRTAQERTLEMVGRLDRDQLTHYAEQTRKHGLVLIAVADECDKHLTSALRRVK